MKKKKDTAVYIWDILYEIDCIDKALQLGNLYDLVISRSVLRSFTVIGEASKRVDEAVRIQSPDIPWQKIIGIRNIISHDYDEINLQIIEKIIANDMAILKNNLLRLYKTLTGTDYHAN